ncbi:MAG: HEAT repeat domain-containing protein, partial [Planctomycetota bacterium]
LLEFAGDADEQYAAEAVGALGRLAERGELAAAARERVVTALRELFERMPPGQAVLRERVLWALGNLDDARCGAAFVTGLRQEENAAVRLTAARGLAVLADPQFADALASAASDPDPGVRRLVVETLASLGSAERHLDSLWERLTAPGETDDNIRQVALRGVVEILARSPTALLEGWCARLPQATPGDRKRALELLERLVKPGPGLEPADHERAGLIQARLAAQYALADRPAEAITAYRAALTELRAADVAASGRVALELLQFALTSGRYDATIALALGEVTTAGDAQAIWRVVQTTIEARLNPEGVEQVLALLTAVEKDPPCTLTAAMTESVGQWRARAAQLKPAAPPATQTAGVPQRQPG